ncbi:hypothetical protein Bca4012_044256 [Brassica carinata]
MKLASHAVIMRCNVINAEDMDISKGNVQWPREEDSKVLGAEKLDTMRCRKKRYLIRTNDNESEKDEVLDLVDFGAHKDEASTSSESDSESEKGKYDDLKECYKQVCGTTCKLRKKKQDMLVLNLGETQKGKTESVSMSTMKPLVKMYARTTSYGKTAMKTATATRTASSSATRKIPEVKSVSRRPFVDVCYHFGVVGHIRPKCFRLLRENHQIEIVYDMRTHGPTCYSCGVQGHVRRNCFNGDKEACQEVRRDVRQAVRQEVLHWVAVSNKPKVVHQCTNMKVGHKKVECFANEKSRNMAKKMNKTFIKPKRVEDVFLAKSGLLDEIKDETSKERCRSGRSNLEVDQKSSSLEPGHRVVCGIKEKEIELCLYASDPLYFEESGSSLEWQIAMKVKMQSIEKNSTWELLDALEGKNVIGLKWVYRTKYNNDGSVQNYKARLVAKGYAQTEGMHY